MNTLPTWFQIVGTALVYLFGLFGLYIGLIAMLDASVIRRTPRYNRKPQPVTSVCGKCGANLVGRDQLAAWRAYVRHHETNH